MDKIHDKMPVILTAEEEENHWLDPDQNTNDLISLLKPYPADAMEAYEISPDGNKPANNYPEILDRVAE